MKIVATGADSSDTFTIPAGARSHGLRAGRRVRFLSKTGGSNLGPLPTVYFVAVANLTTRVFSLATTRFGAAVNLGSDVTAAEVLRVTTGKGVDG